MLHQKSLGLRFQKIIQPKYKFFRFIIVDFWTTRICMVRYEWPLFRVGHTTGILLFDSFLCANAFPISAATYLTKTIYVPINLVRNQNVRKLWIFDFLFHKLPSFMFPACNRLRDNFIITVLLQTDFQAAASAYAVENH